MRTATLESGRRAAARPLTARGALLALAAALASATGAHAQADDWRVNEREYLERGGANVLVFNSEFNGMFFDEKTAGVELILHETRIATGGAVRVNATPEQWDPIPKLVERKVDRARNAIEAVLRYEDFNFDAHLVVKAEGQAVSIAVRLDRPLPAVLAGRAGLNLEFLPSRYFGRTYLMDGRPALFARHPSGPSEVKPAASRPRQFQGYSTFEGRARAEYVEPAPVAAGKTLVLAPEDPERHVTIRARTGDLQLLDGRNVAQNGWFVVRTLLPSGATGTVAEWLVEPHVIAGWRRTPVIGYSQAGYHPSQKKVVVLELDPRDPPADTASLFEVKADGAAVERLQAKVRPWGPYLRYAYATADFSAVTEPGLYFVRYGSQRTAAFPIDPHVYDGIWHLTQDVWFPVQMDHMRVNEGYRVWHGLPHQDDARQAPVGIQHFDNYRMGATTETRFAPGERIPGLAVGGWFDAGDFDIETDHHAWTVSHLVDAWERFRPMRDETLVDQGARFVDIHHPDGKPDLLQQIEHGALMLAAQHRAFGRGIRGITDAMLQTYTHLGDASTQTDNLPYDPKLAPYRTEGGASGTPDDRWAFTARMPAVNYDTIAALAAAGRALRGYDDAFAQECLTLARTSYAEERKVSAAAPPSEAEARVVALAELSAVVQLLTATRAREYAERFDALAWPLLDQGPPETAGRALVIAVRALPSLDAAAKARLRPHVVRHRERADQLAKQNPYGVPITTGGWAGNNAVISWAVANDHLRRAYPDLFTAEDVLAGLHYILGRHPASNVSFVSGVGARSKTTAYGSNRADYSFIPGGVVPGVLVRKPDFPEHMEDWPFLWGENEYVIDIAANYMVLAQAAAAAAKEMDAAPAVTAQEDAKPPAPPQRKDAMTPIATPDQPSAIELGTGPLPDATAPESWHSQYGSPFARNVTVATLTPFLPDPARASGAAVVVAPGGGFRTLSMENEGWNVARALAERGVAAFVLKYRLNQTPADMAGFERSMAEMFAGAGRRPPRPDPQEMAARLGPQIADSRAAFALIRRRAAEWRVDPDRIGMVGFSAGATLTMATALVGEEARPAFIGNIYGPLASVTVPADAPPLFAALAADDPIFANAGFGLIESWRAAKRPAELHLYERGGHGFGMYPKETTSTGWFDAFVRWLTMHGMLAPRP